MQKLLRLPLPEALPAPLQVGAHAVLVARDGTLLGELSSHYTTLR